MFFFHYKSMGEIDPHGVSRLDPMGLIDMIYVVEH